MEGFFQSFGPLFTRYKAEVILLTISIVICGTSLLLFFQQQNNLDVVQIKPAQKAVRSESQKKQVTVDVSGAVKHPFVYSFPDGVRIIDVLQKAGGLTPDADAAFVRRSINYARMVTDQEKIYFPFIADTAEGIIVENRRIIDYTSPNNMVGQQEAAEYININSASLLELDQLPGIGKVQSEAIINGRPYNELADLIQRNVIKQSVYDKIKGQISVY